MYYDKIISIGSDCSVAGSLRNLKYKDATYPFDWCVSKISFILDCFDSDFLCYENIFNKISNLKESGNGYIQYNDKIFFHHEVKYKNLNDKLLLFYKNKYNKRIDRFRKLLKSNKKILLVRKTLNNDEIYEIIKLLDIIKNKYKLSNISILCISDKISDLYSNNNLQIKNISSESFLTIKNNIYIHKNQSLAYDNIYNILKSYDSIKYEQPKYRDNDDP